VIAGGFHVPSMIEGGVSFGSLHVEVVVNLAGERRVKKVALESIADIPLYLFVLLDLLKRINVQRDVFVK